jgi:RimJ/RimL family protein N-acetyltransferase
MPVFHLDASSLMILYNYERQFAGGENILEHFEGSFTAQNKLSYRKATFNDCDTLYAWANDPHTRENAHNKEPILYENHVEWFRNKLNSADDCVFIVTDNTLPVALLRLDKKGDDMLLSYTVAPECRGKGIGGTAISMLPGIIKIENVQCKRIIADVYKTNIASCKIFINAGYQVQDNGDLYSFTVNCK